MTKQRIRSLLIGSMIVFTTASMAYSGILRVPFIGGFQASQEARQISLRPGNEVAVVYIGSSVCPASTRPELRGELQRLFAGMKAQAEAKGHAFASIGIAKDLNVEAGLEHLKSLPVPFDEVMTGRGWLNSGLLKYIYNDHPGRAATPQILVLTRVATRDQGGWNIVNERLIERKVGLAEIMSWSDPEIALPQLSSR